MSRSVAAPLLCACIVLLASGCLDVAPAGPSLAERLLLPGFPHLVLEVDHHPDAAPSPAALAALVAEARALTGKPVTVVGPTAESGIGATGDRDDVVRIHRRTADQDPGRHGRGDAAYLHVLYLDGLLTVDGDQLHTAGSTYTREGLIAVFPDAYASAHTRLLGQRIDARGDTERVVLLHELGHALGLVGEQVPQVEERGLGDGHSRNVASVMYPRLPLGPDGLLTRELPRGFDGDDIRDLESFKLAHRAG